ncbi:MAG: hypothetical protein AAGB51_06320 [Planctomycetota bacterium]
MPHDEKPNTPAFPEPAADAGEGARSDAWIIRRIRRSDMDSGRVSIDYMQFKPAEPGARSHLYVDVALNAMRFARECDADNFMKVIGDDPGCVLLTVRLDSVRDEVISDQAPYCG